MADFTTTWSSFSSVSAHRTNWKTSPQPRSLVWDCIYAQWCFELNANMLTMLTFWSLAGLKLTFFIIFVKSVSMLTFELQQRLIVNVIGSVKTKYWTHFDLMKSIRRAWCCRGAAEQSTKPTAAVEPATRAGSVSELVDCVSWLQISGDANWTQDEFLFQESSLSFF